MKNFFETYEKCYECRNERVHFCYEDYENPYHGDSRTLSDIEFSVNEIKAAMKKTPPNMSSGPDGLPGIIFHNCTESLSTPIYLLWRKSIQTSVVPKT